MVYWELKIFCTSAIHVSDIDVDFKFSMASSKREIKIELGWKFGNQKPKQKWKTIKLLKRYRML